MPSTHQKLILQSSKEISLLVFLQKERGVIEKKVYAQEA
jgi:hypothetical protein